MGCDAYANVDGVFEIEVTPRAGKDGRRFRPQKIRIGGLEMYHEISIEILKGRRR